jgi:adenylate kinase
VLTNVLPVLAAYLAVLVAMAVIDTHHRMRSAGGWYHGIPVNIAQIPKKING